LPDRIEERRDCPLGDEQRKLYLAELRRSRDQIQHAVAEQGLNKSKMHVLAALTRLRQVCCHPSLVGSDTASPAKPRRCLNCSTRWWPTARRFWSFRSSSKCCNCSKRNARRGTSHAHAHRPDEGPAAVVNAFQADKGAGVFLLSLRAAGTGLNLTNASYVVLYDPWWNPAVEAQAIDRSHRIGQTQTVNAYRLIAPGTVEEKIWELQQSKAQTIADVLGEEGFARSLTFCSPRRIWNILFAEGLKPVPDFRAGELGFRAALRQRLCRHWRQ
jgi:SNF2 family DNA or RNA helicase